MSRDIPSIGLWEAGQTWMNRTATARELADLLLFDQLREQELGVFTGHTWDSLEAPLTDIIDIRPSSKSDGTPDDLGHVYEGLRVSLTDIPSVNASGPTYNRETLELLRPSADAALNTVEARSVATNAFRCTPLPSIPRPEFELAFQLHSRRILLQHVLEQNPAKVLEQVERIRRLGRKLFVPPDEVVTQHISGRELVGYYRGYENLGTTGRAIALPFGEIVCKLAQGAISA